ncbi:MAG: DMT family transporter [Planctomycetaceae bacterium]
MSAESPWSARLLVISAAVLWSLSGVVLKSPAFADLPAESRGPVVAGLRAVFAALVLLPMVRPRAVRWHRGLIPMTFCFAAMSILFISALMQTTAAATIFLQYTSVVWACLLGWLILKERPGRHDAVALACVAAGIGIILAHDLGSPLGNALALGSGVAYAGVVISLRALRDQDPYWLSFLNQAVCAVIILPWLLFGPLNLTLVQIALIAFLGAVQLALPYVLFAIGIKRVPAGEASLLLLVEPVLNPVWVLLVWGEPTAWTTWAGGAIILGGLCVRLFLAGGGRHRPVAETDAPRPSSDAAPRSLPARP